MKNRLLALLAISISASLTTTSAAVVTAPVGYVKLTFNANADTPFSLPMNRPKAYAGKVDTISGNVINIDSSDFTASQFVYADGTQNEKYYVLFTTGSLEGRTFDVTANSATSLTVNQDGDTNVQALINNATAQDLFEIRPHWTLNTLFPDGENFPASTNYFTPTGALLTKNSTSPGINASSENVYIYFDSSNDQQDGWYNADDSGAGSQKDFVLKKSTFYVYRNLSNETKTLNLVGDTPITDIKNNLKILSDFIDQDNYVSLAIPIEVSLNASGLANSPSFKKTTDFFNIDGDRLLFYKDNLTELDPASDKVYIYFDSSNNQQDGWYDADNAGAGKQGDAVKFKPGKGYVIRKIGDSEETFQWSTELPYNPFAE